MIPAGALERPHERSTAFGGEVADEASNRIVDQQREIGLSGLEFLNGLRLDGRIHREGDVVGDIDRRRLYFGSESVALLEGLHLQSIDGINHAIKFVVQLGLGAQIQIAGQHQIHGSVEIRFRSLQLAGMVIGNTALISRFNRIDKGLHLWCGGRCCRSRRRSGGRNGGLGGFERGSGRLRWFHRTLAHRIFRHTTVEQQRRRSQHQRPRPGIDLQSSE